MKKLIALFCALVLIAAMVPAVMAETKTGNVSIVTVVKATPTPTPSMTPLPTLPPMENGDEATPTEEVAILSAKATPTPTKRPVVTKIP